MHHCKTKSGFIPLTIVWSCLLQSFRSSQELLFYRSQIDLRFDFRNTPSFFTSLTSPLIPHPEHRFSPLCVWVTRDLHRIKRAEFVPVNFFTIFNKIMLTPTPVQNKVCAENLSKILCRNAKSRPPTLRINPRPDRYLIIPVHSADFISFSATP